jgi:hypothetical protein
VRFEKLTQCISVTGMTELSINNPRRVEIVHVARDALYENEKPYAADFSAPQKSSNHIFEVRNVFIEDIRCIKDNLTLDKNGFCILNCPTSATFESLSSGGSEMEVLTYYQQMKALVLERFPEYSRVVVLEHQVLTQKILAQNSRLIHTDCLHQLRKRDRGYPEEVENTHSQPARLAHRDFTTRGLYLRMDLSFPDQVMEYRDKDMDFLKYFPIVLFCSRCNCFAITNSSV